MRKYFKLTLLTLALSGWSCQGFLDENPKNFIAPTNYYQSASDALASVNAVYDMLSHWGAYDREIYLLTELSTDNMDLLTTNQERVQIDDYQMDAGNSIFRNAWQNLYEGATRANITVDRVPGIKSMDAKLRDRIVGEARFLRAFYYYNLVRLWGDVPLVMKEVASLEGLNIPRTPAADVYTQIIADLQYAEQTLPPKYTGADVGRVTSGAARSLLTSVYLTRKQWPLAAAKAQEVIDSKAYQLYDNYADNFAIPLKNGKESIFEGQALANTGGNDQSRMYTNFAPMPANEFGQRAYGGFGPTPELFASYEPGDTRKALYLTEQGGKKLPRPLFNKYVDPAGTENNNSNNWPYLRYADVLLMAAEALNEAGKTTEALPYLNQVRKRAGLAPVTGTDQAEVRAAIRKDRRLELVLEGHRWFELVRYGTLVSTMKAAGKNQVQEVNNLFPIPLRELDTNPALTQNPGY